MSITIRTRCASGHQHDERYPNSAHGLASLEVQLALHHTLGNVISPNGSVYTITDEYGVFVQQCEIVPSM